MGQSRVIIGHRHLHQIPRHRFLTTTFFFNLGEAQFEPDTPVFGIKYLSNNADEIS